MTDCQSFVKSAELSTHGEGGLSGGAAPATVQLETSDDYPGGWLGRFIARNGCLSNDCKDIPADTVRRYRLPTHR